MLKPILSLDRKKNDSDFIGIAFGAVRMTESVRDVWGITALRKGIFYGVAIQFSFDVGFRIGFFEPFKPLLFNNVSDA